MNAPVKDPARAVLARTVQMVVEKRRFPLEDDLRRQVRGNLTAMDRLLADGRYLVRIVGEDGRGPLDPRIAPTVLGLMEAQSSIARSELEGLERTRKLLRRAVSQRYFDRGRVLVKALHQSLAPDLQRIDFARWCTWLCSPRLQGRYGFDPYAFYGWSDAQGLPNRTTGFFDDLYVAPSFVEWDGPPKPKRRDFLLSEEGLRVVVDEHAKVAVYLGTAQIAVLEPTLGANVLAALVSRPHRWLHSLDLQTAGLPGAVIDEEDADPDWVSCDLFNVFKIEFEAGGCTREEVERLAALIRRGDFLQHLKRSGQKPPKWAPDPVVALAELTEDVTAALVEGPIHADHPRIKNATRSVRRALDTILEARPLAPFAKDFHGHERISYRPSA